jgi:small subunit ribosomal protein S4
MGVNVARYTDAVCRLCRRENMKLFLKGERCLSDKCAINKRNYAPGQHGQRRAKLSEYGLQLREKQKVKRTYGVLESQFRRYFQKAARSKEVTGSELLVLLERRLDNVVYLMGFADSRAQARQLVQHGHIRVNGRRVNIPSFLIKQGDIVEPREKSRELDMVRSAIERLNQKQIPVWIHVDAENMRGVVQALPKRHDLIMPFHEQLIVELYSK